MAYQNHHFELDKILHSKMNKIYIFQALHTFAKSLIGFFVPIYLYKCGFSLIEIIFYNLGISIVYLLLIPHVVKLIKIIGFKYTLLVSIPFYLMQILFLNFVIDTTGSLNYFYFNFAWIFYGCYLSTFWLTFHSEIALSGSTKHRNSQMGTLQIITSIFGTFAPIIGGFVMETTNYFYLFSITSFIILIGLVPLLSAKDIRLKNYNFRYKDYFRMVRSSENESSKIAFAFEGFNALLLLVLWPIIVFQFLNENYFNFGALVTGISFISVIIILYLKSYFDKKRKKNLLRKISKVLSFSWFLKSLIFFMGIMFLFIFESLGKLVWQIFQILYSSIFYNNAKKKEFMDYIILRELYLHTAKFCFGIALILIFIFFGTNFMVLNSIVLSGTIIALGLGFLREEI